MANIELKKVEEQLNHRVLYSVKVNTDADHMEFPIGIQDQGSASCKRNRCPHLRPRLRRRTRGGGATPVGSSNASLTAKICGLYRDGAASRPSLFEPEIGVIGLGGNKGGIVGRSHARRRRAIGSFDLKSPRCAVPSSE